MKPNTGGEYSDRTTPSDLPLEPSSSAPFPPTLYRKDNLNTGAQSHAEEVRAFLPACVLSRSYFSHIKFNIYLVGTSFGRGAKLRVS